MTCDRATTSARLSFIAPVVATIVLAMLLLTDAAAIRWHVSVDWPWWLNDLEHLGSAWCNRILPYLALLVALIFNRCAMRQLIVALPMQMFLAHAIKWIVGRVRPVHGDHSMLFAPFSSVHESFPSGHSALVWTIAFAFAYQKSRSTALWVAAALFVCWARLHTYAHFPSDLFAGAMVGWVITFTSGKTLRPWIESGRLADLRDVAAFPRRLTCLWLIAIAAPIGMAMWLGHQPLVDDEATARERIGVLYEDYLGRDADAPGLTAYASQRLDGLPLLAIARDLLDSDEFRKTLRELTPEQRVDRMYQLLLHRKPTADEMAHDVPLVEGLSRQKSRLPLLVMRLTWR